MKGSRFFIDTNVFVRIVAKDDPVKLKECERLIEKIRLEQIAATTSSLVMAEVVWTLLRVYGLAKAEVVEVLKSISSIKNLRWVEKVQFISALELFGNHNAKFIDCLIASHPKIASGEIKVISYDKDFDLLRVARVEPGEIV